jgi:hypothetical protein
MRTIGIGSRYWIGKFTVEVGAGRDGVNGSVLKQSTTIEVGILTGEVSEFVDKTIYRKNIEGDLYPAPRSTGSSALDRNVGHTEVLSRVWLIDRDPELEELRLSRVALPNDGGVDEAVAPGNKISFPIEAGSEAVHASRTVSIMCEVVFARPNELDRSADTTLNLDGLVIKSRRSPSWRL